MKKGARSKEERSYLLKKSQLVQLRLPLKEMILKTLPRGAPTPLFKEPAILNHRITRNLDPLNIVRTLQRHRPRRPQPPHTRVQFRALVFREVCAERVDGDVDCAAVCFEEEDFLDDGGGWGGEMGGEIEKVFEVGFVEGVSDDFDV